MKNSSLEKWLIKLNVCTKLKSVILSSPSCDSVYTKSLNFELKYFILSNHNDLYSDI